MMKWGHYLSTSRSRGKWRGLCTCGWQSERLPSSDDVVNAYKKHTRIVEKEPRRKPQEFGDDE